MNTTNGFRSWMKLFKAQLKSLREVMDERHNLYKERAEAQKTAVDDALVAVKEQTAASFLSSEKAIVKAEEAQKAYNTAHNDLSRKMDDQYKNMVPASEARLKWDGIDKAVEELRKDQGVIRESGPREISILRAELMKEITNVRDSQTSSGARLSGKEKAEEARNATNKWIIGLVVLSVLSLLGSIITLVALFMHAPTK